MKRRLPSLGLLSCLVFSSAVLGACDGVHTGALEGTWRQSMYGVASLPPGHVTSSDLDLAFNGDGSSIWALTTVYGPTARTFVAGCTEVTLATGMSWSSSSTGNAGSLSVQGTATRTVERSDCNDAGVNQSAMPALDEPFVPRIDNELYRINGNTLTFTDSGSNTATLTRQ